MFDFESKVEVLEVRKDELEAFITYLADWRWESLSFLPISLNGKCLFNPLQS